MKLIVTALAVASVWAVAPTAVAEDRVADPVPLPCSGPAVDCGAPTCVIAIDSVRQHKRSLHEARRNGSPSRIRKAKRGLAKAKRRRRADCRGFVR